MSLAPFWCDFWSIWGAFFVLFGTKWVMRELHPLSSENQIFEVRGVAGRDFFCLFSGPDSEYGF